MTNEDELKKLLELAASPAQANDAEPIGSVHEWAITVGIKPGNAKLTPYHLWSEYTKWARHPVGQQTFFKTFRKLFISCWYETHSKNGRYYKLDPSSFDMTLDTYFQIQRSLRDTRAERKARGTRAYKEKV